jgi:hypothetical protein
MLSSEVLSSIETELTRARNMAEHADFDVLCYLIDMAISEVKSKAYSNGDDKDPPHGHNIRSLTTTVVR